MAGNQDWPASLCSAVSCLTGIPSHPASDVSYIVYSTKYSTVERIRVSYLGMLGLKLSSKSMFASRTGISCPCLSTVCQVGVAFDRMSSVKNERELRQGPRNKGGPLPRLPLPAHNWIVLGAALAFLFDDMSSHSSPTFQSLCVVQKQSCLPPTNARRPFLGHVATPTMTHTPVFFFFLF